EGREPRPLGHRDARGVGRDPGGRHPLLRAPGAAGGRRHQGPRPRRGAPAPARPGRGERRGEPPAGRRRTDRRRRRRPRRAHQPGGGRRARARGAGGTGAGRGAPRGRPSRAGAALAQGVRADLAAAVDDPGRHHLRLVGPGLARRGQRVRERGDALPGGHPRAGIATPPRPRPRALGALPLRAPSRPRAVGGGAGAPRRRPGPVLVGCAHPGSPVAAGDGARRGRL
ncbi:MAG: ABC-type Fe3+-hydroxamate transport system, periplasmic component, partial [uncultured Acidimicrobiales bacterium]